MVPARSRSPASFYGTFSFGSTTLPDTGGSADIFLTKLNANGTEAWAKSFGSSTNAGGDVGEAVAFDSAGNIVLTGDLVNTLDFGGGLLTAPTDLRRVRREVRPRWRAPVVEAIRPRLGRPRSGDRDRPIRERHRRRPFSESEDFGGGTMLSPGGADGFVGKFAARDERNSDEVRRPPLRVSSTSSY